MGDFIRCIDLILAEEGGYVNHPNDPGGETNFGISQRAYPHLNIKTLTRADAIEIYWRDYWTPIYGDHFPDALALLLLDSAVNQGITTAVRLLQQALKVPVDGLPGPVTQSAARHAALPGLLIDFCAERAYRYQGLRQSDTFGRGWYRRLFRVYGHAQRFTP